MSWEELNNSPEPVENDTDKALRASLRAALEDKVLRKFLVRTAAQSGFTAGQADVSAFREGVRSLAVKLLELGGHYDE